MRCGCAALAPADAAAPDPGNINSGNALSELDAVSEAGKGVHGMELLNLPRPHLLFLGDVTERGYAKTAMGLRDWVPDQCVGEFALPGGLSIGLPAMSPAEAAAAGARSLAIGVANPGGVIPEHWLPALHDAVEHG